MLRTRWIGVLLACLAVAGIFAWLGQWQLARAIDTNPPPPGMTENVQPLESVVQPGQYLPEPYVGQKVETEGTWVPDDFIIVSDRYNDGTLGYWVTGQLRLTDTTEPTSIAVAIGWANNRDDAEASIRQLNTIGTDPVTVTGRVISDEGTAVPPRGEPDTISRMSPAMLLGRWHDTEQLNVYRPYLASSQPEGGLVAISSPAPEEPATVNWLNMFYAAEWIVFAGFAFYLWYRLAKDAWEREVEEIEDAQAAGETAASGT
ncbi:SURF1 family protein [Microbacterium sp. YY-01]|uniref:SURF1 family protein n=1 Tax=Microbacterium sp. YY-01 TaxID=3421634 RepID=UPI003D1750D1